MRRIYVIRHVAFEDLGLWRALLTEFGAVRYFQAGVDELAPCIDDNPDLLIVLGAPIGVYETEQYPFIRDELKLIRRRLAQDQPMLGVCLGAQLIAAAAGARVYASGVKEIGWGSVQLTAAGERTCLRQLATSNYTVLHWHGDTFDLPADAELLASTALVKHQAFTLGKHTLALQFHVEADPTGIEPWLIAHACELAQAKIQPSELRSQTAQLPDALRTNSVALLRDWLRQIEFDR